MGASRAPWAQCPARGPGLAHIQDGNEKPSGECVYCGCPWNGKEQRWGNANPIPNVDPALAREYAQVRKEGLGDQDAQALVAHLHGLSPGEGQTRQWTLEELNRLMVMRKTHRLLGRVNSGETGGLP